MLKLLPKLDLDRCPHCNVDKPNLTIIGSKFQTVSHSNTNKRFWQCYICASCGGVVTAVSPDEQGNVTEIYPTSTNIEESVPLRARQYLEQALNSLHSPAGAVMLAASSVDAMLKAKAYKDGSLFRRIEDAAKNHLITEEMAKWAHQVRLDANEQRHADEEAPLPTDVDAKRIIDFAMALAQFLFVLPDKVQKGIHEASDSSS